MATANLDEVETDSKFYENIKEYNFDNCLYSLLIVGPCGAGKSAFCNFLLKEERFKEAIGLLSGTQKADYCTIPCRDGDMLVVDCPGFCDPKRSHEEIMTEFSKAAILCRNGMDAIGIVIDPTSRFTETQKISYEQIDMLGGEFWKHAFIIFSREKKIEKNFGCANAYIQQLIKDPKCPAKFKQFLDKVHGRYICVESKKRRDYEDYWCETRDKLLAMVIQIKEDNAGVGYVNAFMKYGQTAYKLFLDLTHKLTQATGLKQDRVGKQSTHIKDLEKDAVENPQLDALQKKLQQLIADYESKITDIKKASTKSAKDSSYSCSPM